MLKLADVHIMDFDKVREFIHTEGEAGYAKLVNVCIRLMNEAQTQIKIEREKHGKDHGREVFREAL